MRLIASIIFLSTLSTSPSRTLATPLTISSDFTGSGKIDTISYNQTDDGINIDYFNKSSGKHFHYHQSKFDECSSMGLYIVPNTREFAVDGSCQSQGGQIYTHIYEWSKIKSDWCLVREITGEKPDINSQDFVGSQRVSRVSGCPRIGDDGPYNYASEHEVKSKINEELTILIEDSKNPSNLKNYIHGIPFYYPLEISENLTVENVEGADNLVFYLSESGRTHDALQLLKAIVQKFPERVVAKLNLADAYWESQMIGPSKKMYASYVTEMRQLGKAGLIPSRAINRM